MARSISLLLLLAPMMMFAVACADAENVGLDGRVDTGERDAASSSDASSDSDDARFTVDVPTDDVRITVDANANDDARANDAPVRFDAPTADAPSTFDAPIADALVSDEPGSCGPYLKKAYLSPGSTLCCDGSDVLHYYGSCAPVTETVPGNCVSAPTGSYGWVTLECSTCADSPMIGGCNGCGGYC